MSNSNLAPTRGLTADLFVTLDGYAKGDRSPAYFGMLGPELEHWIEREMEKPQTIVMGRVTYESPCQVRRRHRTAREDAQGHAVAHAHRSVVG